MRKYLRLYSAILVLCLAWIPTRGPAQDMEWTEQELYNLTVSLFKAHEEHHAQFYISDPMSGNGGMVFRCKYPEQELVGMLECLDFGFSMTRILPKDAAAIRVLFSEMLRNAVRVAKIDGRNRVVDASRIEALQALGSIIPYFPEPGLWITGEFMSADMIITPFYLKSLQGEVIDGRMYFMLLMSAERTSQIWICADQAVVYSLFSRLDFSQERDVFTEPVLAWMADYEAEANADDETPALAAPTETLVPTEAPTQAVTPTPAPAAESPQPTAEPEEQPKSSPKGEAAAAALTVTTNARVNLRESNAFTAAIVGKADAGTTYEVANQPEDGWVEVRQEDGSVAFLPVSAVVFGDQ